MAQAPLTTRVAAAADALLGRSDTVSPVDVLVMIGWLQPSHVAVWEQGRVESLEEHAAVSLERLLGALRLLEDWAKRRRLATITTTPIARTPARTELRYTREGRVEVEQIFRTTWVSPKVSAKKRERLEKAANDAPELVVIEALKDWKCHRCQGSGPLLVMEPPGPSCLACAGLGDLVFLASGDANLTRRARAASARKAVVVRFSRTRKRYERQGTLVEPVALESARTSIGREGDA